MRIRGEVWLVLAMTACSPGGEDSGDTTGTTAADDGFGSNSATASESAGETSGIAPDARPNWYEDVAPVVAANCRSCHTDGGLAFPFDTYEQAAPWAPAMAAQTADRLMPPWHAVATDECTPPAAFEHDARLDDDTIAMFAAWSELGGPAGDPAKAAPLPDPPSLDLADPDQILDMGGSITIEYDGAVRDRFHCLSFDPKLTEDVYVDGIQVIPGNTKVVHHALVFVDEGAQSAAWDDGMLLDCGGGPGITDATLVAAWVPGSLPVEPPAGVGIRLPAGARIVFNVHYHVDVTGPQLDDSTALGLRYDTTVPEWVSEFALVGAPGAGNSMTGEFVIPAGASDHDETIHFQVPATGGADVRVWSVGHHMHKVGVDERTSVLRGDDEICLVQTPRWDFGWQRLYEYDLPIDQALALATGDIIEVRCTYDNTLDNPQVIEMLDEVGLDQPTDVALGEGTLDEMCLAGVGYAYRP